MLRVARQRGRARIRLRAKRADQVSGRLAGFLTWGKADYRGMGVLGVDYGTLGGMKRRGPVCFGVGYILF